jgi:hypothetical protein
MAVGFLALAFLADRPETAKFLNAEERALAIARIKAETVGSTHLLEATHKATVRQGILNINSWICGSIMLLAAIAVQGYVPSDYVMRASAYASAATPYTCPQSCV